MKKKRASRKLEIPMSAMIDIVFLLLIFFITTFHENKAEAQLLINMPKQSGTPTVGLLEVWILPDTYRWMGTRPNTLDAIQERLISAASFDADATVVIKVHPDATEGQLLQLLDRCAYAGLTRLNVLTLKTAPPPVSLF